MPQSPAMEPEKPGVALLVDEEQPADWSSKADAAAPREGLAARAHSRSSIAKALAFMALCLCLLLCALKNVDFTALGERMHHCHHAQKPEVATPARALVPLEAHVMSKCPDTRACLRELVLPVMERAHSKVDFRLTYLGRLSGDDGGVECLHGTEECIGDIVELCAARLYPTPRIYLGFAMCLSNDYPSIPDKAFVRACALEHGVDFERLNECASSQDDELGLALLRESVLRSKAKGVESSCTVRLNDEVYCVHDGDGWRDCPKGPKVNDLVLEIEKLYNQGAVRDAYNASLPS